MIFAKIDDNGDRLGYKSGAFFCPRAGATTLPLGIQLD